MDMNDAPQLSDELQQALDAGNGVVQGSSFVLMRPHVVLEWFGYTEDDIRSELQPAIEQAERGEVSEWNLDAFLAEMHQSHKTKAD